MKSDYIPSWDETFMKMCDVIGARSKDPSTKNGSVVVNNMNVVLGMGYNGWPRGIENDQLPWARTGEFLATKYPYVCHAEENAIYNASLSVRGAILYTRLYPCNECAKTIIQCGIVEVVYTEWRELDIFLAARFLFELVGVRTRQFGVKS